jgi:hypothetical protein
MAEARVPVDLEIPGGSMNVRFRVAAIALAAVSVGLAACGSTYYLVKDPESGREYYTTKVERSSHGTTFKDGKSLSTVTLQNSEIIEITKDQYRANTGAR